MKIQPWIYILAVLPVATATAAPTVSGARISWQDEGWYQVQDAATYESVCQGGSSCDVPDGLYIVINHATGERFEDVRVGDLNQSVSVNGVTVSGSTISWPDDGWYQVQDTETYTSVCDGGRSCEVGVGTYTVINHSSGERFQNIRVSGAGAPDSAGEDSPAITHSEEEALQQSPVELERTWQAAWVSVPDGAGGVIRTTMSDLESGVVVPAEHSPVVIWMHGCSGFWSGTRFRMDWLAGNGFVVIAPWSFAREFYPQSCDVTNTRSGLYRPTLKIRQYDAGYAIAKSRGFSWVDKGNVFLAGFSEGAAVVTTYSNSENPQGYLKGRIAEAWGCHAGWSEFVGINAPANEGVLALVADRDPWYTSSYHQGDCGEFMSYPNGSQSVVVDYGTTRFQHALWQEPDVQEVILNFLLSQLRRE